jgi:hypothetical protein
MRGLIRPSDVMHYAYSYPQPEAKIMRPALALFLSALLAACGVETATTAATSMEIKKREMDQAKQTMDMAKQRIEQNTQQIQQRADQSDPDKAKD